eukprot:scaffold33507_cov125-Skeletonema_dohrnii-CCMP3373.AAC.2
MHCSSTRGNFKHIKAKVRLRTNIGYPDHRLSLRVHVGRAIRCHFSFFEVDLTHTGTVMNYFLRTGTNPLVYVVLCGRMTPTQKQIVKDRARLDAEKVINLLELFLRKSGHLGYKHVMPPTDCPQPTITSHNQTRASMARNRNLSKPCLIGQCQR